MTTKQKSKRDEYEDDNELNNTAAGQVDDDDDELEIEIEDDTPPEDRNREPLPDDIKKELDKDEDDEFKEHSANVKKRIKQLKKAYHDERRAKEAAFRERDEAAQMGQRLHQERQQLRAQLSQGETWALSEAKQRADLELKAAKAEYRMAHDEGDSEKLAEAQARLSRATSHYDQVNQMKPRFALQDDDERVYNDPNQRQTTQQQAPKPDQKTVEWGRNNPWFGSDPEMTSFSLGVHQKLVNDGIMPGTDEYFEKLDSRMRKVFPDEFDDGPDDVTPSDDELENVEVDDEPPKRKQQPSTVVAPVSRTPKSKKVVLTKTQVATAKRLGITPQQYARELQELSNQE